uniref:Uncharacterized protein n=1 Tax=viral metagenome TaxID=1070528 RepID=A0A2V0R8Z0_9ZZZZ
MDYGNITQSSERITAAAFGESGAAMCEGRTGVISNRTGSLTTSIPAGAVSAVFGITPSNLSQGGLQVHIWGLDASNVVTSQTQHTIVNLDNSYAKVGPLGLHTRISNASPSDLRRGVMTAGAFDVIPSNPVVTASNVHDFTLPGASGVFGPGVTGSINQFILGEMARTAKNLVNQQDRYRYVSSAFTSPELTNIVATAANAETTLYDSALLTDDTQVFNGFIHEASVGGFVKFTSSGSASSVTVKCAVKNFAGSVIEEKELILACAASTEYIVDLEDVGGAFSYSNAALRSMTVTLSSSVASGIASIDSASVVAEALLPNSDPSNLVATIARVDGLSATDSDTYSIYVTLTVEAVPSLSTRPLTTTLASTPEGLEAYNVLCTMMKGISIVTGSSGEISQYVKGAVSQAMTTPDPIRAASIFGRKLSGFLRKVGSEIRQHGPEATHLIKSGLAELHKNRHTIAKVLTAAAAADPAFVPAAAAGNAYAN